MGERRNYKLDWNILKINENERTTYQILWDSAKAMLRGKFIAVSTYIKKEERSQVSNLTLHLKELEKKSEINTSDEASTISFGEDVEKLEQLHTVDGIIKWCSCYGKWYGDSSKD